MATNNFGIALRGWRERLSPVDAGLAPTERRRIQGLRREELARLAGLSVDYVVRLEQGRARYPSAQVVNALARALRLAEAERDHLFRCASLAPPASGNVPTQVPTRVSRLVRRLDDTPVAVFSADWTLISWNRMWAAAIGEPDTYGWVDRNLVAGMFRSVDGRRPDSIAQWPVRSWQGDDAEEAALVADLRVTAAHYPADARLTALVDRMIDTSPRFARLWFTGTAGSVTSDRKAVAHPVLGEVNLDLEVLLVAGVDLRIVTYTGAEGTDAGKLDALRAPSWTT
jgi:transcriptional regulator with XRE-family HTH domain